MADIRTTRRELGHIRQRLGQLDQALLDDIDRHRYLSTSQVARLHFTSKPNALAALRATNRALARLRDLRLISALDRRIGGVRAGSGSYVWRIAPLGHRLLHEHDHSTGHPTRRRATEPSLYFLKHTLAIAELHLALRDCAHPGHVRLAAVELEPASWRQYLSAGGATARLKPDLVAVTETADFEDHWFFEVDLATEAPSRILEKCQQYERYLRTGLEQRRLGVFPAVAWIVPDTARRRLLTARIGADATLTAELHRVITMDQLSDLLLGRIPSVNHDAAGTPGHEPVGRKEQST